MATKDDLMAFMANHIGGANGITGAELATQMSITSRAVRNLVAEAREEGIAICGHPSTGYFVAKTKEEIEATIAFLQHRAMHSLRQASRLGNIPLPDLIGQLHLRT